MKVKLVYSCLMCGIRIGSSQSAFCYQDAKRLGVKLMWMRHRPHLFRWSKLVEGYYGKSIFEELRELRKAGGGE